jgi:hypothetical protein
MISLIKKPLMVALLCTSLMLVPAPKIQAQTLAEYALLVALGNIIYSIVNDFAPLPEGGITQTFENAELPTCANEPVIFSGQYVANIIDLEGTKILHVNLNGKGTIEGTDEKVLVKLQDNFKFPEVPSSDMNQGDFNLKLKVQFVFAGKRPNETTLITSSFNDQGQAVLTTRSSCTVE